uniref:LITAF domain-containing protein n=1 Tax=Mesocestoides corti TaxID=53468 RepID=A0A5K3ERC6_MESCO
MFYCTIEVVLFGATFKSISSRFSCRNPWIHPLHLLRIPNQLPLTPLLHPLVTHQPLAILQLLAIPQVLNIYRVLAIPRVLDTLLLANHTLLRVRSFTFF